MTSAPLGRAAAMVLACVLALAAGASAASAAPFVYVTNNTGASVTQLDAPPGPFGLFALASPIASGESPYGIAARPGGGSLYVANQRSDTISQYDIGVSGQLSPKEPAIAPAGDYPFAIAASPDGRSLYVTNGLERSISQYDIGALGVLTPKIPGKVATALGQYGIVVSPNGRSAYVANYTTDSVWQFDVGAGGALRRKAPPTVPVAEFPFGVAISPDGASLYVASIKAGTVSQYDVAAGGVLRSKAPPTVPAPGAYEIAVAPDGGSVYVTDAKSDVRQFDVLPGGLLRPKALPSRRTASGASGLAVSPDGTALHVAGAALDEVARHPIGANGALGEASKAGSGAGVPRGLAIGVPAPPSDAPPPLPPRAGESPNACLDGTGSRSWCGDGGPGNQAKLAGPSDVAVAPDGAVAIADTLNNVIRLVRPDGRIFSVAGTGERGPASNGRADRVRFDAPAGVATPAGGGVLVADTGNDAIRAVSESGAVTTLVSRRGPIRADLQSPRDVLVRPDGSVLIANTDRNRVLAVSPGGTVEVVAGSGRRGFSGDGGQASAARLSGPTQLALAPNGALLIADTGNGAVRRVLASGAIETVTRGLKNPQGVLGLPSGSVVVADETALLRVARDGSKTTIAGGRRRGFNGDRGRALALRFDAIRQIALHPRGGLVFAERGNDRIRRYLEGAAAARSATDRPRLVARRSTVDTAYGSDRPIDRSRHAGIPPGRPPRAVRGDDSGDCRDDAPRFQPFHLVPPGGGVLDASGSVRLRFATGRRAEVVLELYRGSARVLTKTLGTVGPRRLPIAAFRVARGTYVAKLWGRSGGVMRCAIRRLQVR